jgi:hypothetical protein
MVSSVPCSLLRPLRAMTTTEIDATLNANIERIRPMLSVGGKETPWVRATTMLPTAARGQFLCGAAALMKGIEPALSFPTNLLGHALGTALSAPAAVYGAGVRGAGFTADRVDAHIAAVRLGALECCRSIASGLAWSGLIAIVAVGVAIQLGCLAVAPATALVFHAQAYLRSADKNLKQDIGINVSDIERCFDVPHKSFRTEGLMANGQGSKTADGRCTIEAQTTIWTHYSLPGLSKWSFSGPSMHNLDCLTIESRYDHGALPEMTFAGKMRLFEGKVLVTGAAETWAVGLARNAQRLMDALRTYSAPSAGQDVASGGLFKNCKVGVRHNPGKTYGDFGSYHLNMESLPLPLLIGIVTGSMP